MNQSKTKGLFGILGIWLTAGFALPFVNVLDMFTTSQLMVFRGFLTAAMALIGLRGFKGAIEKVDRYTYLIALILPLATLGLYQGIRYWGAGPTIIVITATPVVNFLISPILGRKISTASVTGLVLILSGVIITRWEGEFHQLGFAWSLFGMIMNGILYELFSHAKSSSLQKCFWACLDMGVLGLLRSTDASWSIEIWTPQIVLYVFGFAFIGGFIYWIANLMAFDNLPTNEASTLAQGETPAVILGASLFLNEQLTLIQWVGVAITLYGALNLSRNLAKKSD